MLALPRLRRLFLDVHLWLGLGLGLALVPLGLSGSALVFQSELEKLLFWPHPGVTSGPMLAPSAYLAAAKAPLGERFPFWQISYPERAGAAVAVSGRALPKGPAMPPMRRVYLDPPTARVLGTDNPRGGLFATLQALHGSLLIRVIGRSLVGWLGWAMTISCATGLWLWWPRGGGVLKGLRWQRSPSTNTNLHHLVGFCIFIPLSVLSLTGVYICFPQTARMLTEVGAPKPPAQPAPKPAGGSGPPMQVAATRMSVDGALEAAQALAPGLSPRALTAPWENYGDASGLWQIEFDAPGDGTVEVEDATGAARIPERAEPEPANDLPLLVRRIHDGRGMGPLWRSIIFVAGLAPAVLAFTGTLIWLRRRGRRRALKPAKAS